MDKFPKWAKHEYSPQQRFIAIFFEGIVFVILIPLVLFQVSDPLDAWLGFGKFKFGSLNYLVAVLFILSGWAFALWAVQAQFTIGRGTPAPMMATQKLVIKGPYAYCRNPMILGIILFFLGVGVWLGSWSVIGLVLLFAFLILVGIKRIEERGLASRFGKDYLQYRKQTPFLIPHSIRPKHRR